MNKAPVSGGLTCYPVRLQPGQEIKSALMDFVTSQNLRAAFVMTCVGSVSNATLRLAFNGQTEHIKNFAGHYEILSLVGTFSTTNGTCHLHASLGDKDGHVIGGHVVGDMIVYTTAEVVIGDCQNVLFNREYDERTGFNELVVDRNK